MTTMLQVAVGGGGEIQVGGDKAMLTVNVGVCIVSRALNRGTL